MERKLALRASSSHRKQRGCGGGDEIRVTMSMRETAAVARSCHWPPSEAKIHLRSSPAGTSTAAHATSSNSVGESRTAMLMLWRSTSGTCRTTRRPGCSVSVAMAQLCCKCDGPAPALEAQTLTLIGSALKRYSPQHKGKSIGPGLHNEFPVTLLSIFNQWKDATWQWGSWAQHRKRRNPVTLVSLIPKIKSRKTRW